MSTNKYRVHRFDIRMASDQSKLEQFLNSLEGEINRHRSKRYDAIFLDSPR